MLWFCLRIPYLLIICKQKNVMQMSEFFFRVLHQFYLLLDKEEKVTKRKTKLSKYLILCKTVCSRKTELHLGNKRTYILLLSKYFFLAQKHTKKCRTDYPDTISNEM